MRNPISWDELWIKLAFLVAKRSKDPNTQCGCVLVSPDNREISTGYNGFPVGIEDTEERWKKPQKYLYVNHAEAGAILNSRKKLVNWRCYLTMLPCENCAKMLIQAGISRVIYKNEPENPESFSYGLAKEMLKEAGIYLSKYDNVDVE